MAFRQRTEQRRNVRSQEKIRKIGEKIVAGIGRQRTG
jgi:hypothetical protein